MSRGPILALATYIYLLYILNCKKDIKYAIMLIFFFTLFILLFLNFQDIVVYINNVLLNYNINIRFLNKIIFLLEEGKFDNGRLYI